MKWDLFDGEISELMRICRWEKQLYEKKRLIHCLIHVSTHIFAFLGFCGPFSGFIDNEIDCNFLIYFFVVKEKMLTHQKYAESFFLPYPYL